MDSDEIIRGYNLRSRTFRRYVWICSRDLTSYFCGSSLTSLCEAVVFMSDARPQSTHSSQSEEKKVVVKLERKNKLEPTNMNLNPMRTD